jgi:hypothetical protein
MAISIFFILDRKVLAIHSRFIGYTTYSGIIVAFSYSKFCQNRKVVFQVNNST